jgi:hypothetical protein
MSQVLQIAGALCILAGFGLSQAHRLDPRALPYLLLNLIGSAVLTVLAFEERQWGFFLLEGVWAIVSVASIIRYYNGRTTTKSGRPNVTDN